MIHQAWRLSEYGEDNLGLACTEQGLVLGRTPLIERRDGRFVVRDQSEIECLLSHAYRGALPLQRLMEGFANVANGIATSVKSIDLNAATYQNDISLANRLLQYVEDVRDFDGATWGGKEVSNDQIAAWAIQLIVPKGSMTAAQRAIIDQVREIAKRGNRSVDIIVTEF
jgi:hypothetical protein